MPKSDRNITQHSFAPEKWIDTRSCTLGCLGYVAGILTLPIVVFLTLNTPDARKQRFLERKTNECQRCDLSNQDLSLRQFNNADFSKANLQNVVLGGAKLRNAKFSYANLKHSVLRQANLENANFDGANLSQADFRCGAGTCTYLSGTSFKNANLTGANFQSVGFTPVGEIGLPNVDFTGADLREANFNGASLKGALLERAKFCKTRMPDGKISNRDC
ncbi:pentapeptide repeat-containing protein [Planktothrix sp. FACHB-1375]|uniref:Pentapeptide repeat-containing protein n=3 Tax=Oscillatoriophycideae TaxID=1301283 RepID=A0A926VCW3_9CYAN|nr:pentapeptide repeat-containing protein [Aerosakkonema funiforme FACHB-1375]